MSLVNKRLFSDTQDLGITQKCALINAFWPHLNISESDYFEDEYTALFSYWGETLRSLRPFGHEFAIEEWDGILAMITQLSFGRDTKKEVLVSDLRKHYQDIGDKAIACSIELTVRLWIGVNVRSKGLFVGPEKSRVSYIRWQDDHSLKEMVAAPFINNKRKAQPEPMLIPRDLLDETICTLDLLFPEGDEPTETFLNDEKVQMWIENSIDIPQAIELDDFEFWRSRLSQLLSLFYGPPETRHDDTKRRKEN
ncbi:unnamed protein product [Alternaria alternata]